MSVIASASSSDARRVDVHVAVARRRVDHRHRGDALQRRLQPLAAARDDQVDEAGLRGQLCELLVPPPATSDIAPVRQPGRRAASTATAASTAFECARRSRPAQHDRVAGLQAERGGVDRHVRPRLVHDRDHTQRHPDLADVEAVRGAGGRRSPRRPDRAAPRCPATCGDRRNPAGVEREPVHQRVADSPTRARLRGRGRWPRGSPASARSAPSAIASSARVLDAGRQRRELRRGALGGGADVGDGCRDDGGHRSHRLREHEVVPVDRLVGGPRQQLADVGGLQPSHPPQLGRRVVADPLADQLARRGRPRPRRRRRTRRRPRRSRPAAGSCRPRAARAPRRRRRAPARASAWRT